MQRACRFALSIWLPVLVAFTGCSEPDPPPPPPPLNLKLAPPSGADPHVDESFRPFVAFATNGDNDFWKIAEVGCNDASEEFKIDVAVLKPSDGTIEQQQDMIQKSRSDGIAGLAICPVDGKQQVKYINRVFSIIELVTFANDAPDSERQVYIGADNYSAGRECADLVKQILPDGGNIVIATDKIDQGNNSLRRQGLIDALLERDRDSAFYRTEEASWDAANASLKNDKYTILGTLVDDGDPAALETKAEALAGRATNLDAIVGLATHCVPACLQALEKTEKLGTVKLVGFGEDEKTLQAIKDGNCEATIVEDPYQYGYESIRVLRRILELKRDAIPEDGLIYIPTRTINKENLDEFWTDLKSRLAG